MKKTEKGKKITLSLKGVKEGWLVPFKLNGKQHYIRKTKGGFIEVYEVTSTSKPKK